MEEKIKQLLKEHKNNPELQVIGTEVLKLMNLGYDNCILEGKPSHKTKKLLETEGFIIRTEQDRGTPQICW
jgi:hypothetical protein